MYFVDLEFCLYLYNDLIERLNKMVDGFVIVIFLYILNMYYKLYFILIK